MKTARILLLTIVCSILFASSALANFTLWPLIDVREDPSIEFKSTNLLGPIVDHNQLGASASYGLRPFFYHLDAPDQQKSYILPPLLSIERRGDFRRYSLLKLFTYEDDRAGIIGEKSLTLFPFVFYEESEQRGNHLAVLPFFGRLDNRFGRDTIEFMLFPLFSRTKLDSKQTYNVLWPFFSYTKGDNVSGYKFWPFYGLEEHEGKYKKSFTMWPFLTKSETKLDTDHPVRELGVFPFYHELISDHRTERSIFYIFKHVKDTDRNFEEWAFPWPILGYATGPGRHAFSIMPFYSRDASSDHVTTWYGWPFVKYETIDTEYYKSHQTRFLYALFSDTREQFPGGERPDKRTISLWPLTTYASEGNALRVSFPSIVEPIFGDDEAMQSVWTPLLTFADYRKYGNQKGLSVLWNLIWWSKEENGTGWGVEPILSYRSADKSTKWDVLKGLVGFDSSGDTKKFKLFYIPFNLN